MFRYLYSCALVDRKESHVRNFWRTWSAAFASITKVLVLARCVACFAASTRLQMTSLSSEEDELDVGSLSLMLLLSRSQDIGMIRIWLQRRTDASAASSLSIFTPLDSRGLCSQRPQLDAERSKVEGLRSFAIDLHSAPLRANFDQSLARV